MERHCSTFTSSACNLISKRHWTAKTLWSTHTCINSAAGNLLQSLAGADRMGHAHVQLYQGHSMQADWPMRGRPTFADQNSNDCFWNCNATERCPSEQCSRSMVVQHNNRNTMHHMSVANSSLHDNNTLRLHCSSNSVLMLLDWKRLHASEGGVLATEVCKQKGGVTVCTLHRNFPGDFCH